MILNTRIMAAIVMSTVVCGCTPRSENANSDIQERLKSAIAKGQERSDARFRFSQKHPHKGVVARDFISGLNSESFKCQLQYRDRYRAGTGADLGTFSTQRVPSVECFTQNYEPTVCQEFRVSIGLAEVDPQRSLKLIANELNIAKIEDAHFICEDTPLSAEEEALVAQGIKEGFVVPLSP